MSERISDEELTTIIQWQDPNDHTINTRMQLIALDLRDARAILKIAENALEHIRDCYDKPSWQMDAQAMADSARRALEQIRK